MSDRLTPVIDAMRTAIVASGFSVGGETLAVLKRKAAVRRQGLDPDRLISIAASGSDPVTTRRRFGLHQTAYVIDVVVHAPFLADPDAHPAEYSVIRDSLVDLFKDVRAVSLPGVFDLDAQSAGWLRPYGERSDYDWFAVQVTATVAHA